ncbi:MAG: hypothetical protein WCA00_06060 [Candidatus Acidiferrales bacterium]
MLYSNRSVATEQKEVNTMSKESTNGAKTTVQFEGETRGFKNGGNCADGNGEAHDSPRAKGKHVSQNSPISKCCNDSAASVLDESKVTGTKRRERGAAEKVRSANNVRGRDVRTNLGVGKSSSIVTD